MTTAAAGPTLDTRRLRLAPCGPEHVDALHEILVDEDVRRYLLDGKVVAREWVAELVAASGETFAAQRFGLWCLCEREQGTVVGMAGLRAFAGAREPQLLYALARAWWGRGYATEASAAVADYAFDALGYRELLASTDPPNRASIGVMERLGMRFLEAGRVAGHALVFYALRREDWLRRREGKDPSSPAADVEPAQARP